MNKRDPDSLPAFLNSDVAVIRPYLKHYVNALGRRFHVFDATRRCEIFALHLSHIPEGVILHTYRIRRGELRRILSGRFYCAVMLIVAKFGQDFFVDQYITEDLADFITASLPKE